MHLRITPDVLRYTHDKRAAPVTRKRRIIGSERWICAGVQSHAKVVQGKPESDESPKKARTHRGLAEIERHECACPVTTR